MKRNELHVLKSKRAPFPYRRYAPAMIGLASIGLAFLLAWETCGFSSCPDTASLRSYQPGGAPVLLDRTGNPLGTLAPADRKIVPLAEMPRHLPEAFLAVEDQRFLEHDGIDWRRV